MAGTAHRITLHAGRVPRLARPILAIGSDREGAAAVTFALTLPALLTFVYGIVEFGRVMWTDHALAHAAAQAARYVIANPEASSSEIETYAESQVVSVDKGALAVTVAQETIDGAAYLTVRLTYPLQALLPFAPFGPLALTGLSRIRLTT